MGDTNILERITATTPRTLDFFKESGLVAQTGHPKEDWPLVVLKELADNALDACEDLHIAPALIVTADDSGISVQDNGPGLPASVVAGMLDYSVQVSSRSIYVSPTRGAQGNALKTLAAMPYVLDGEIGKIEITACGVRHEIEVSVDQIQQTPRIEHRKIECEEATKGTLIKIHWPDSKIGLLEDSEKRFLRLAKDLTFMNPHLELTLLDCFHNSRMYSSATNAGWEKWLSQNKPSPHWYDLADFESQIAAYLKAGSKPVKISEFLHDFYGLSSTVKRKEILDARNLGRQDLSGLLRDGKFDAIKTKGLLDSMKANTKPVKPISLGLIGESHLRTKFAKIVTSKDMERFRYKKFTSKEGPDSIPWIIEAAFAPNLGKKDRDEPRKLIVGVNWSPAIGNPFRRLGRHEDGLDALLEDQKAGDDEPVVVFLHLTTARSRYTDRGKSATVVNDVMATGITDAINHVTKEWVNLRRKEERAGKRERNRHEKMSMSKQNKVFTRNAAFEGMEEAYLKASGSLGMANARQVYYAARPTILEKSGAANLEHQYFCDMLIEYMKLHPEKTRNWDILWDNRGNMTEPHTGEIVPLGTLAVRNYIRTAENASAVDDLEIISIGDAHCYPTSGPKNRFAGVLYIEKEGFMPIIKKAKLAERYDLAIMCSKGQSTTAARQAIDWICGEHNLPLFVLHDFDEAGFSILHNVKQTNERYTYRHQITTYDLGIRLQDITDYGLESEPVDYKKPRHHDAKHPGILLRKYGVTEDEIKFLVSNGNPQIGFSGSRVELNSFTTDAFIDWIETKLKQQSIKKVIADDSTLVRAYCRSRILGRFNDLLADEIDRVTKEIDNAGVSKTINDKVAQEIQRDPSLAWDDAAAIIEKRERNEECGGLADL